MKFSKEENFKILSNAPLKVRLISVKGPDMFLLISQITGFIGIVF